MSDTVWEVLSQHAKNKVTQLYKANLSSSGTAHIEQYAKICQIYDTSMSKAAIQGTFQQATYFISVVCLFHINDNCYGRVLLPRS